MICHVPLPGESDDVWWFGFDCAHSGDLVPSMLAFGASIGDDYRSLDYVIDECSDLAKQLHGLRG